MTDITLCVTPKVRESMGQNQWKAFTGHLGTHFDVMDKVFPMEYAEREGIIFDVSRVGDGEVQISDIDLTLVKADMAVLLRKWDTGTRPTSRSTPPYRLN